MFIDFDILNYMCRLHIQVKIIFKVTITEFYNVLSSLEAEPSLSLLFDFQTFKYILGIYYKQM